MKTMTPKEIAVEFGTDGRTLRKFLRSITPVEDRPGKGSRWSIPASKSQLTKLQKNFDAWVEARAAKVEDQVTDEVTTPEVEVDEETTETE